MKVSKINLVTIIVAVGLIASMAGAVVTTTFGSVKTTIHVTNLMVTIDEHSYTDPVIDSIDFVYAGTVIYGPTHTITNHGPNPVSLSWTFAIAPEHDPTYLVGNPVMVNPASHQAIVSLLPTGITTFCFEYRISEMTALADFTVTAVLNSP